MHTKAAAEAEPEPEPLQDLAQGSGFIFLKPWAVKAEPKPRVLKPSRALTSLDKGPSRYLQWKMMNILRNQDG